MNSNMNKKQKPRQNTFAADFNDREEDFILVDLDVIQNEAEPPLVPLNHFLDDEETIDRLLINTGFDVHVEPEEVRESGTLVFDDINRTDEFGANPEEQYAMTTDIDILDSAENEFVLDKEENPETAMQERVIGEATHPKNVLENLNNDAGITLLRTTRHEQEKIKKQITNYENKIKKAAIVTYTSLSFGVVALLSTVVMGIIVSGVQTKVSKLTDLVSILEEDVSSITEKNSDMEINNGDSSIEQQSDQKGTRVQELSGEQIRSSPDILENELSTDVTKHANVNLQPRLSVLEKKKQAEATVKKVSAEKKENNAQTVSGWSVNLTAYEDLSYAKSKAKKLIQKGIPVKITAVNMNNTTWYRLRVGGFKDKQKATSYAVKIKETLNLNTISVSNI
jgi:cell division septation protein DedD